VEGSLFILGRRWYAYAYLLMVIFNKTYRKMQNEVPSLRLPWNEPYISRPLVDSKDIQEDTIAVSGGHSSENSNYVYQ
jgi:hypothetical protein